MTARLSTTLKQQVVRLLLDLADNRGDDAAETMIEVGTALPDFDREAYIRDIAALMARNYNLTIGEIDAGAILYELINISYQRGLRLPAELTLLAKALFNLELGDQVTRLVVRSDSDDSRVCAIRSSPTARSMSLNPRRLYRSVTEGGELLAALPHRLDLISARMASNEFSTKVEVPQFLFVDRSATEGGESRVLRIGARGPARRERDAPALSPLARHQWASCSPASIGLWMVLAILWTDRQRERRS